MGVCLEHGVFKKMNFVVNIYSMCALLAKRLWDTLVEVQDGLGDGVWCFLGNFNTF